jgi:hypothetical protein
MNMRLDVSSWILFFSWYRFDAYSRTCPRNVETDPRPTCTWRYNSITATCIKGLLAIAVVHCIRLTTGSLIKLKQLALVSEGLYSLDSRTNNPSRKSEPGGQTAMDRRSGKTTGRQRFQRFPHGPASKLAPTRSSGFSSVQNKILSVHPVAAMNGMTQCFVNLRHVLTLSIKTVR